MIEVTPATDNKMSYTEAVLYSIFCNHNGYTDWRMPTQYEWLSDDRMLGCWYENRAPRGSREVVLVRTVTE